MDERYRNGPWRQRYERMVAWVENREAVPEEVRSVIEGIRRGTRFEGRLFGGEDGGLSG